MYKLLFLFGLIATTLGAPQFAQNGVKSKRLPIPGRIVGGEDADIEDYNYQGTLLFLGSFICGLALISENYAVTAAHCTDGGYPASYYSVRLGSSYAESGGVVVDVASFAQNPLYDPWTIDFDVSVLQLAQPVNLSQSIGTIEIATNQSSSGDNATITGFGVTQESGNLPDKLQVAQVPVLSLEECQALLGDDVTERMLCAGQPEGGLDACQGDSGGPLVINGKLAGIVSWGYGCARPGLPGVYTNVPAVADYIRENSDI